jgi:micrococcal nuclease
VEQVALRVRTAGAVVVLVLGLAGCALVEAPVDDPNVVADGLPAGRDTVVREVVDGDTIVVGDGESVRLIGVDTPETRHPAKGVQCFGREAARQTAALLPRGTRVRLVHDVERTDRYGRTLAYVVRVRDGLFVNAALLRDGFGQPLTIPPNVAHADSFRELAGQARASGRGLWGACPAAREEPAAAADVRGAFVKEPGEISATARYPGGLGSPPTANPHTGQRGRRNANLSRESPDARARSTR